MTIISGLPNDTVQACRDINMTGRGDTATYIAAAYYVNGHGAPHYPLPAIALIVDHLCDQDGDVYGTAIFACDGTDYECVFFYP